MKLFFAGGEGLPRSRHQEMHEHGVKKRLTSFFVGESAVNKVVEEAVKFENKQREREEK